MSMGSRMDDGRSSKLFLPGVQKNKTNPIIEWTIIIGRTSISDIWGQRNIDGITHGGW